MRDQALWMWHLIAGVIIAVFLGLHMATMHLDAIISLGIPSGGHPVDWANVVARGKSVFILVSYIALLGAALYHGLYGFRNILFELGPSVAVKKALNAAIVFSGLALFGFGLWIAIASFTMARGL